MPTHHTLDRLNTVTGDDTFGSDDTLGGDDALDSDDTFARDDAREGFSLLPVVDRECSNGGLVTVDALAPYLSRHRLEITRDSDPLSLPVSETPDPVVPD